jgi:hypothetical protein
MTAANSAQLLRLVREIAGLERSRQSLPLGYLWIGDALLASLRAEQHRLENMAMVPDLSAGGGSEPDPEEPPDSGAKKTVTSVEASGRQCDATEATPNPLPEAEAATDATVEGAPQDPAGEQERTTSQNLTSQQPSAVAAEPASDGNGSDSGASDNSSSDKELSEADVSDTEKLIAYIADRGGVIHVRALMRGKGKRGNEFSTAAGARAALQRLVDAGHGSWVEEGRIFRLSERPAGP